MSELRQHLVTLVNNSNIRTGVILNGRQHIVVNSKTLPFDVLMNGIVYPKEEIENTFHLLDGTPAPIGHPKNAAGELISAKTQEGRNLSDIGAWNRNPRIVGNRVELETWIDVERAKLTAEGREVLDRIEKREPISTSVAVLANVEEVSGKKVARIKDYDHNAILLQEPPAAGFDKGVGMLINTSSAVSIHEPEKNIVEKVYNLIMTKFKGQDLIVNEEENKMEKDTELHAKIDRLHESIGRLAKLLEDKVESKEDEVLANELKEIKTMLLANSNKELEEKRAKVAQILGNEDAANGMNEIALDSILANSGSDHKILGNSHKSDNEDNSGYGSAWEVK